MPLGPHIPAWRALRSRLADLAESAHAENAFVLDAWGNLWCSGHAVPWPAQEAAIHVTQAALAPLRPSLPRGGRIDAAVAEHGAWGYVRSFAGVYVVLLWYSRPFELERARSCVAESLPTIATLTTSLPPSSGPGSASGEGFGVA